MILALLMVIAVNAGALFFMNEYLIKERDKHKEHLKNLRAQHRILSEKMKQLDNAVGNLSAMGIDVHYRDVSWISIYSSVNGGQIRNFPVDIRSMVELRNLVESLKRDYNIKNRVCDVPPRMRGFFDC